MRPPWKIVGLVLLASALFAQNQILPAPSDQFKFKVINGRLLPQKNVELVVKQIAGPNVSDLNKKELDCEIVRRYEDGGWIIVVVCGPFQYRVMGVNFTPELKRTK